MIATLGPEGTLTLTLIGWIIIRSKSKTARRAERRALKAAARLTWNALAALWWALLSIGHPTPTKDERRLLHRLRPAHWKKHAHLRGLQGTLTARPRLTKAGIVTAVRLDGTWTPSKLRSAEDNVRALLGAKASLRIDIDAGKRGGWATLTVRTRSAADGTLVWKPGDSLGVDTITGKDVHVPLGQRMLIAGRSGSGKSWAARPLLVAASEGDTNVLVIIDLKKVEGRLWEHRARVASTPDEVLAVVAELVAEMNERLDLIPRGQDTLVPSADRPRISVFVDEGAEVMSKVKDALDGLESLARMGRAVIIDLWWATQKPTMSGASAGIPAQIAPQLSTVMCLAVRTPTEARTVLGEDAQSAGWNADRLPAPGFVLVRTDSPADKPHPVRTRKLSPKVVIGLVSGRVWARPSVSVRKADSVRGVSGVGPSSVGPVSVEGEGIPGDLLSAVFGLSEGERTPSVRDRVLSVVVSAGGPVGAVEVSRLSGVPSTSAHRVLRSLVASGVVVQDASRKYGVASPTPPMV